MSMFSFTRSDTHAIALLEADHRKVEKLHREFERARDAATRVRLARQICEELTLHAELEERLFYPAALRALDRKGDDLVLEAAVEHRTLKQLIVAIDGTGASDRLFEANVTVLMEYVKHHVREEERELFPKLEKTKLDLEALGERMLAEKRRLAKALDQRRRPATRSRVSVASFGPPESSERSVARPRGSGVRKPARGRATPASGKTERVARGRTRPGERRVRAR